MKFDVYMLSTTTYILEEIISEDIPEKYLYDEHGEFLFASTILNSEKAVSQLINFLFQSPKAIREVYRDKYSYVLDLSLCREQLVDCDYLEKFYLKWIEDTGRDNTMDEYGMLLDYIGYARKRMEQKYLLMIITNERNCS